MSSSLFSILAQSSSGSDWNWFLIFIVFVIILAVALIIQAMFSKQDAAEIEQQEAEAHHEEPAHEDQPPAPPAVQPEPEPESPAEDEPDQETATEAVSGPESEVAVTPETPAKPDDLKKLEGIGPKVAALLNDNGITTFADLAGTPVENLEEILAANKLQMLHPGSWPQQARLAADGDWEALQKLQDDLQGGRE